MSLEQFVQQFGQALANGSVYSLLIAAGAGVITTGVCPCTLPVGLGIAGLVSSNSESKSDRGFMIAAYIFPSLRQTVSGVPLLSSAIPPPLGQLIVSGLLFDGL